MDINDRLYVEIHPLTSGQIPHPHPVDEARFEPGYVYKVLGMYNPSETSECYMILSNPQQQIWFIPQRHLLAYALLDSDEFYLTKEEALALRRSTRKPVPDARYPGETEELMHRNGNGRHVSPV
jgi:hypothetical protein